jgi:cell division protein FtsX
MHKRTFTLDWDDMILLVLIVFVFGMFFGMCADLEALK